MRTFEIGKDQKTRNFYWLYVRHFDGIETNYTPVEKLTNEEAWALAGCNYCPLGSGDRPGPTNISPKDLLKIKPVNVMGTWPEASPIISNRLVLVLPENKDLKRDAVELVDPWYHDNPGNLIGHNHIQQYRVSSREEEREIELINSIYPQSKPDPEPLRAIKFALENFKEDSGNAYIFLHEWSEGTELETWPEFEHFQKPPPRMKTRIV